MILHRLFRNRSGLAMTEFALTAPFLLTFGLWGIETANLALSHTKVSQLAMHVADNASRIGDTSTLENRKLFEEDINDILIGANLQAGASLDFFEHGRLIISSLEVWDQSVHSSNSKADGVQFIHWQRCLGKLNFVSDFGNQNSSQPNGLGPTGQELTATNDSPVIFVEVAYQYQPLVSDAFISSTTIKTSAAFVVRDSRDQSQLYKRNVTTSPADCSAYSGI